MSRSRPLTSSRYCRGSSCRRWVRIRALSTWSRNPAATVSTVRPSNSCGTTTWMPAISSRRNPMPDPSTAISSAERWEGQFCTTGCSFSPITRDFVRCWQPPRDSPLAPLAAPQGGFAPTQAMFNGDFSTLPATIYDPASFDPATGKRLPFAGNAIPSSRLNPMAQKMLPYYLPGSSYNLRPLNVFQEPVQTQVSDQGGLRVDANLTTKHTLFAQYMQEESPVDNPALFPVSGLFYHMNTEFAMVQLTSALTPSLVNELHLGFTRPYLFYGGIGQAGLEQKNGLTGTADVNGVPGITLGGFSSFGTAQSVIGNIDNNYQMYDSLKLLHGRHEIQLGASLHYIRTVQESANFNARGTLVFNSVFTAQLAPGANGQPAPIDRKSVV